MGDMADDWDEQGLDAWLLHVNGECGVLGFCPYCEDEARQDD